jgi:hypothetical protein
MKRSKISCEQDAITWVSRHLPILIKPSRKSKYPAIHPFISFNAFSQTAEHLGKKLWKLINQ